MEWPNFLPASVRFEVGKDEVGNRHTCFWHCRLMRLWYALRSGSHNNVHRSLQLGDLSVNFLDIHLDLRLWRGRYRDLRFLFQD